MGGFPTHRHRPTSDAGSRAGLSFQSARPDRARCITGPTSPASAGPVSDDELISQLRTDLSRLEVQVVLVERRVARAKARQTDG